MNQLGLSLDPAPSDAPPVNLRARERICECGCGIPLTGRQERFASRLCSSRWWDAQHPRVNVTATGPREGTIKEAIFALISDGQWRTAQEIAVEVRAFPHSVSARLAEIRRQQDRLGVYRLESDAENGCSTRAHRFRLVAR